MKKLHRHLLKDSVIIAASIGAAVALGASGALDHFLAISRWAGWLGSFLAGIFFTSIFTTAPAIVALGGIAQESSLIQTAFFGALGAVAGDLLIFRFVRARLPAHLPELASRTKGRQRLGYLLRMRIFRWLSFLLGGLIIASPLPDELGVGLLGFARLDMRFFVLLSFVFNFIGIYAIGAVARSVVA